jgi:3-oxoacyl-[acyl-carrier protein] reductase
MTNFQNRVAIITGAGSGLGAVTAIALSKLGVSVVLCGRRKGKVEEVKRQIEANGGSALAIQADVSNESDVQKLIDETVSRFGRIDILINNAAVFQPGSVLETSLSSWNEQIAINLNGPYLVSRASLPIMRKQKYGRIINITSALAQNGSGGFAAYSAGKAGLEALTRTLAHDESDFHITANLFNPGAIKTQMHATGRPPEEVVPELLRLLQNGTITGKLVDASGSIN